MNAHFTTPAAPATAEGWKQMADAAFETVAGMEDYLAKLSGLFRLMTIIDLDKVCQDDRDVSAFREIWGAAEDAINALSEKHSSAFHSLSSIVNPKTAVPA